MDEPTIKEQVRVVWKHYRPAVLVIGLTSVALAGVLVGIIKSVLL